MAAPSDSSIFSRDSMSASDGDTDSIILTADGEMDDDDDFGDETVMLSAEELLQLSDENEKDYWWYCPDSLLDDHFQIEQVYGSEIELSFEDRLANNSFTLLDIPKNISQIITIINSPDFSYHDVARTVEQSPVLMSEFLKLAKSAWFNAKVPIQDIRVILPRLGVTLVKSVLYLNSLKLTLANQPVFRELATDIVDHSQAVAVIARYLGQRCYKDPESAYLAGLLHNIGKLAILKELTIKFAPHLSPRSTFGEENFYQLFERFHCRIGEKIAIDWSLDAEIGYAIGHYRDFNTDEASFDNSDSSRLTAIIHLSDIMARILGRGAIISGVDIFDLESTRMLGITKNCDSVEYLTHIPHLIESADDA